MGRLVLGPTKNVAKRVKRTKKPRKLPKNWRVRRADQRWTGLAGPNPSRTLATHLGERPPGYVAHHIVAAGSRHARTAQKVLAECISYVNGLGPNAAKNGVWVPATTHAAMHTQHYYNNVNRVLAKNYYFGGGLSQQSRCDRAGKALSYIKKAIQDGSWPY